MAETDYPNHDKDISVFNTKSVFFWHQASKKEGIGPTNPCVTYPNFESVGTTSR